MPSILLALTVIRTTETQSLLFIWDCMILSTHHTLGFPKLEYLLELSPRQK